MIDNLTPDQKAINFLLVGVGGQGTLLAGNILAEVGLKLGFDTKQAEIHGMSQRGGSVISHLRWAKKVFSPIISKGDADILVAFEKMEGARYGEYLKPDGLALLNDYAITPVTVSSGQAEYPDDETLKAMIGAYTSNCFWIKGLNIAEITGSAKAANTVMLGALCALLKGDETLWLQVVESQVPKKLIEINRQAFIAGYHTNLLAL